MVLDEIRLNFKECQINFDSASCFLTSALRIVSLTHIPSKRDVVTASKNSGVLVWLFVKTCSCPRVAYLNEFECSTKTNTWSVCIVTSLASTNIACVLGVIYTYFRSRDLNIINSNNHASLNLIVISFWKHILINPNSSKFNFMTFNNFKTSHFKSIFYLAQNSMVPIRMLIKLSLCLNSLFVLS